MLGGVEGGPRQRRSTSTPSSIEGRDHYRQQFGEAASKRRQRGRSCLDSKSPQTRSGSRTSSVDRGPQHGVSSIPRKPPRQRYCSERNAGATGSATGAQAGRHLGCESNSRPGSDCASRPACRTGCGIRARAGVAASQNLRSNSLVERTHSKTRYPSGLTQAVEQRAVGMNAMLRVGRITGPFDGRRVDLVLCAREAAGHASAADLTYSPQLTLDSGAPVGPRPCSTRHIFRASPVSARALRRRQSTKPGRHVPSTEF